MQQYAIEAVGAEASPVEHLPNTDGWVVTVHHTGIVQVSTMCTCGNDECGWHASVSWFTDELSDLTAQTTREGRQWTKAEFGTGNGTITNTRN